MADVFLSYAREDRDVAHELARALESHGWSVWWDREIHAGEAFDQAIERELARAGTVVVLWSERSVTSEWVKNEASDAAERGVLVPVLLDHAKLPLEFRRRQAADLTGWRGDAEHDGFQALCRGIAGKRPTPGASPARPARAMAPSRPTRWGRYAAAIPLLLVALGAGVYWARSRESGPPSTTAAGSPPEPGVQLELADLVAGTYVGDVVSDARGSSRSDVTVTVARLGARRVRVSADYDRLPTVEVELTRSGDTITSADGPASLLLQDRRLHYSQNGELAYIGSKRP